MQWRQTLKISILKYHKFPEGKVRGVSDIGIDVDGYQLVVNGVKVVESDNDKRFYAMPQRDYIDENGEKKYTSICGFFTKAGYQDFHSSMTSAFKAFFSKKAPANPKKQDTASQHSNYNSEQEDSFDSVPF